jgi:hypothetical protein
MNSSKIYIKNDKKKNLKKNNKTMNQSYIHNDFKKEAYIHKKVTTMNQICFCKNPYIVLFSIIYMMSLYYITIIVLLFLLHIFVLLSVRRTMNNISDRLAIKY